MSELVLVDTSAWIEFSRNAQGCSLIGDKVRKLIEDDQAVVTEIVFVEVARGSRNDKGLKTWSGDFAALTVARTDAAVWQDTAMNAYALGRKGVNVPVADTLISTVAMKNGLSLLHRDKHFEDIARVLPLKQYTFVDE
jgi:predicted nucleic acid-binding protein